MDSYWHTVTKIPEPIEDLISGQDMFGIWCLIQNDTIEYDWLPSWVTHAFNEWKESKDGSQDILAWRNELLRDKYNLDVPSLY